MPCKFMPVDGKTGDWMTLLRESREGRKMAKGETSRHSHIGESEKEVEPEESQLV